MIKEIEMTDAIKLSINAQEIMRIWINDGGQSIIFRNSVWPDPATWGILISDIMRHLANIYAAEGSHAFESAFARIRAGLQAELDHLDSGGDPPK